MNDDKIQVHVDDLRNMPGGAINPNAMRPYINEKGKPCVLEYIGRGDRNDPANFMERPVGNATLRYDEWRQLDEAVIAISRQRLIGYDDLRRNNLVYTLNDPMATTVVTWQKISDAMEAQVTMDPVKRGAGDRTVFSTQHTPIPVVHADFQISERELQVSRKIGNPLNIDYAEAAAHKVRQKLEDMLFGASSLVTYGGGTVYTYQTESYINTVSFDSAGDYWDDADKTGPQIKDDVITMLNKARADYHYGPFVLYVPTDYEGKLDDDYDVSGSSHMTIRQRLMMFDSIQDIRVVDRLTADTLLLVQMTRDVVDLIDGMPMRTVEWDSEGGYIHNYKVMAIMVPRVKSDYAERSGIVKMS